MAKTYIEFKNLTLGKSIDIDFFPKNQPYQCVDLVCKYLSYWGYAIVYCTKTGFAGDIWVQRETNGILKNCTEVKTPKVGDIAVFMPLGRTPFTHVGIVDKVYTNGTIDILGQNQSEPYVNVVNFNTDIIYGYLRPNALKTATTKTNLNVAALNKKPTQFKSKKGTMTVTASKLTVYEAPNTTKAKNSGYYYTNKKYQNTIMFDGYVVNDGYIWISWISANTKTRRWLKYAKGTSLTKVTKKYGELK